jgi:hypothetical protein
MRSQKGQASIEAAVVTMGLTVFMVLFLTTLYLIYASYWVEHILYESLICYQEREQKEFCINQATERIHSTLWFKKSFDMKMENTRSLSRAQIRMKIDPPIVGEKIFVFHKELRT